MSNSPISVKVNPSNRITGCTDPESSRYALSGVMLVPVMDTEPVQIGVRIDSTPITETRPKNEVYAVATDSRCLAVTRMAGMAVETTLCPGKLLTPPAARTAKTVSLNGEWKAESVKLKSGETTASTQPPLEGRFPQIQDVIPRSFTNAVTVTLDAAILARLSDAVRSADKGVTLIINVNDDQTTEDPICVLGDAGFGVIMPLSADTGAEHRFSAERAEFLRHLITKENTEERKAEVLRILNPDLYPVVETPVEETPVDDAEETAHRETFSKVTAIRAKYHETFCFFPFSNLYVAYQQDALQVAKLLGLPLDTEYQGTDHEMLSTCFMANDLDTYLLKLAKSGFRVAICESL